MFRVINFLICLVPLTLLLIDLFLSRSGPDVVKHIMYKTGEATFLLLIFALLMSPLKAATGLRIFINLRRQIGLFVFFYASLHALSYLLFYLDYGWIYLKLEVFKRPYIVLGFFCWLLLLPLAITSTRYHQKLLGVRWKVLHRLVYLAAIFACAHVFLQVRSDPIKALGFSGVVALLLVWRLHRRFFENECGLAKK